MEKLAIRMTLRDYFAIHAPASDIEKILQGLSPEYKKRSFIELVSIARYIYADKMLKSGECLTKRKKG